MKLDMSKVYDKVEWAYLEAIMRKMCFQEKWISLSMMCVRIMSFSILINGEPRGGIIPTRGLRQGLPNIPVSLLIMRRRFISNT